MIEWLLVCIPVLLLYGIHLDVKHLHGYWDYPPYTPEKRPRRPQERR